MPSAFQIKAAAAPRTAEVLIYGDIGESFWSETIEAKTFVAQLAELDVDSLAIRINSFGGSVSDGIAIFNAIKRHPAQTTVYIDGVALSIASLIAMAGDSVEMAENALLMIHAPWGRVTGNSSEMRKQADMLDTYARAMATSYMRNDKITEDTISALLMDGEDHWYSATEAQQAGYIDSVGPVKVTQASFNLARFQSIPAAAAAFNLEIFNMGQNANLPAGAPVPLAAPVASVVLNQKAIEAAALAKDQERRAAIGEAFGKFKDYQGVSDLTTACQNDVACTVVEANARLLAHLGSKSEPAAGTYVATVADAKDKFLIGVSAALNSRAGIAKDDSGNQFRGYTLYDMARAALEHCGHKVAGLDKMKVVAAAFTHTGSDFPALLANVAEKAMMKGYGEAEETFQLWTTPGTLGDFKAARRVDLSVFPSLQKVNEGAEYKSASMGDRGETVQLATYGRKFSISRHAIINDDVDAFTKVPQRMGRAAIRTIGDLVYAVLTSNPTMSDGVALFHADHANLMAGAALNTPSVEAMRVLVGLQKENGVALNLRLVNLIVPLALQGTANVVRDSEFEVGASARNNTVPNMVRGTFSVIADARLDAASSTNWYGAASTSLHDTIEVSYLDGIQTPTLEEQQGWDVDGVEFKVRMDAGVKALDYRGLAKNPN
jgi:ATP-dependent protease ClpP protease subunit